MSKKKWIIISIVAVLIIGGGVGWKLFTPSAQPTDMMPMDTFQMPTIPVDTGDVMKTIFATGVIEGNSKEEVRAEVGGKVSQLYVNKGQRVNKGDLLFTLDSTEARIAYQQQELQHAQLVQQMEELVKQEQQQKTEMISDKSGRIREVLVKEGDQVTEQTIVAKLSQGNKLALKALFNGGQVEHFQKGQKVQVFLPASFSYIEGEVVNVDRQGQGTPEGGILYVVEVVVENPGALSTAIKGKVEYTTPSGYQIISQGETNFTTLEDIEVRAGAAGKIKELKLKENEMLTVGATMGTFEVETTSDLAKREKELSLQLSRLALEQRLRDLEKYNVYAPISGEITELNIEAGKVLDGSKPHLVISDQAETFMRASIEEIDIPDIELGQLVDVYVTAYGNQPFQGIVHEIPQQGTVVDRNVRFDVKILIHDPEGLKPGMTGDCDIIINKVENVPRLPYNAVQIIGDGEAMVMIQDQESGEPTPRQIRIGVEGMDHVEIIEGLEPGEEVMMMGGGGGFY